MVRRLAVVAVLAVVLAGCNAFVPAADGETPTETLTPLAVPTDAASPTAALSPPPGVTADGTVSPTALGVAHREALDGRSFTWTVDYEQRDLDAGAVTDSVSKRLQVAPDGRYLVRTNRSGDRHRVLYADDTGGYARTVFGGNAATRYLRNTLDHRHYLTTPQSLHLYLSGDRASVARVEQDGRPFYRVHVSEPPPAVGDRLPEQTIHNYTATAYVTPEGLVRALDVRYDYTLRSDHVERSLSVDYGRVGETTVDRPAWAAELARAVSTTDDPAGVSSNATGRPPADATPTPDPARVPPPTPSNATATDWPPR